MAIADFNLCGKQVLRKSVYVLHFLNQYILGIFNLNIRIITCDRLMDGLDTFLKPPLFIFDPNRLIQVDRDTNLSFQAITFNLFSKLNM